MNYNFIEIQIQVCTFYSVTYYLERGEKIIDTNIGFTPYLLLYYPCGSMYFILNLMYD